MRRDENGTIVIEGDSPTEDAESLLQLLQASRRLSWTGPNAGIFTPLSCRSSLPPNRRLQALAAIPGSGSGYHPAVRLIALTKAILAAGV